MVDIRSHGDSNYYDFTNIGTHMFDKLYVNVDDMSRVGLVWYDSYTSDNASVPQTVYGWIEPDVAEAIGLALIDLARKAREISNG